MTQRTPQQVLDAALSYLEEHGWKRGVEIGDDGEVCIIAAITKVYATAIEFADAAGLLRSRTGCSIGHWNDHIAKDFNEVRAVMKGEQR